MSQFSGPHNNSATLYHLATTSSIDGEHDKREYQPGAMRASIQAVRRPAALCFLLLAAVGLGFPASATMTLTARNSDGQNTGFGRVAGSIQVTATVTGVSNPAVTWSVTGAGTIGSNGSYQAPAAMPANPSVTISASLVGNSAVNSSYRFSLINPIPGVYTAYTATGALQTAVTNATTVAGVGFVPGSIVLVNGLPVATTYKSASALIAQIPVSAAAQGTLAVSVQNPAPGGSISPAFALAIATDQIRVGASTAEGMNTGTVRLGKTAQLTTAVTGASSAAVNWSLKGAGTVSSTGLYQAPSVMPANAQVTATATLVINPTVSASYSFSLLYPQLEIHGAYTTSGPLLTGVTNTTTVSGLGFVPQSVVLVNGSKVATSYQSASMLTAQIPVGATTMGQVILSVQNPAPAGPASAGFPLAIYPLTIKVAAFNSVGLAPGETPLGMQIQFIATLSGAGNPDLAGPMQWGIYEGPGSISATGVYTAPSSMPASSFVRVMASLAANPAVRGTYSVAFSNPVPVVNRTTPTQLSPGTSTAVTIGGRGFVPGTTLLVNGAQVSTAFISGNSLQATIQVAAGATGGLSLAAQNPDPGASTGGTFTLPIQPAGSITASITMTPGHLIPDDFLGLSYEWGNEKTFEGVPATGVNPIYRQLLKNLLQGHSAPLVIRVGGNSTNKTAEPTPDTLAAYVALAHDVPVRFTLGVNLGANNIQLVQDQARYFVSAMPSGSIAAFELGNEADMYGRAGFRPPSYTVPQFLSEFATFSVAVSTVAPASIGVMGPSFADPKNNKSYFPAFEQQEPHVAIASIHGYVGDVADSTLFTPQYFLLQNQSFHWPSVAGPYATLAHANGQLLRIGEMNSIDHGGIEGISDSFSAALWAIDTMFQYANFGVDGVNWHGGQTCPYCAFSFASTYTDQGYIFTLTNVNPLYEGFLFFQMATQNGSRLLPVTLKATPNVKVWAMQDRDGAVRVAILNKDLTFSGNVSISLAGLGNAQVTRLLAPSYQATTDAGIGGQSFDGSMDGTLMGVPDVEEIATTGGVYVVPVQPASAVLLTIPK